MPNAGLHSGSHNSEQDLYSANYAGGVAYYNITTLEFTWQITNDGYYTWSTRMYHPSVDPSLTNPEVDDEAVRKAIWPTGTNWTNITVPLPGNGWDKQLWFDLNPLFGLTGNGDSMHINSYISYVTVSEFPPFDWPYSDGTNTYGGYELSGSVDYGTFYIMYQGNWNVFNTFGGAYEDDDGSYNGTSQLSANSDSNGNNIPLGEWHKIHMPNPIILRTVNIVRRNHSEFQGAPRKFSIYGSNDNSFWTLLASFNNESPDAVNGTNYTIDSTLGFEYFAIVVEETTGYNILNIAAISWLGIPAKPELKFSYDATGNTFNALQGDPIDVSSQFDVDAARILGNADLSLIHI